MRYRRSSYRYAAVVPSGQTWLLGEPWPLGRVHLLLHGRWQPDVDTYETPTTIEIVVDLAGVDEDDFEVQLFEDAVVVQGRRQLPSGPDSALYLVARIRQGPFGFALSLPAPVDPDRVEARYERGLLRITLGKRSGGA
jgi:HSP20 family protein